ncbi:hypothetical protein HK103_005813 [Boothiomyces macroporosus]|uniref:Uncharacterized protein n=1 Tax=Boothiomyces macroporosus TaxID=261099 RepID=A0AAD5Y757_9FUNG|nr:hypothetical protein HK103_005813 [Boothiomyces macroporosus]
MSRVNILNKAKALLTKPKEKRPEPVKNIVTDSDLTSEILSSDVHSEEEDELKEYLKSLAAKKSSKLGSAGSVKTHTTPKSSYLKPKEEKREDVKSAYLKSAPASPYPKTNKEEGPPGNHYLKSSSKQNEKEELPRNYYLKSSSNIKNAQDAKLDAMKSYLKRSNEKLEREPKDKVQDEKVSVVKINPIPIISEPTVKVLEPAIKIHGVPKFERRISSDEESSVGSDFEKFIGNIKAVTTKPQEQIIESDYSDSTSKILRQSNQAIKESENLVEKKTSIQLNPLSLDKDSEKSQTRDDYSSFTGEIDSEYSKPVSRISIHSPSNKLVTSTKLILDPEILISSDDSDSIKEIFKRKSFATPSPEPSMLKLPKEDSVAQPNENLQKPAEQIKVPSTAKQHISDWLDETSKPQKDTPIVKEVPKNPVSTSDVKLDNTNTFVKNNVEGAIPKPVVTAQTGLAPPEPSVPQIPTQGPPQIVHPPQNYPAYPIYYPQYIGQPPAYPIPHPYAMLGYPNNYNPQTNPICHHCPNCSRKKSKRHKQAKSPKVQDEIKDKQTAKEQIKRDSVVTEDEIPEIIANDTPPMAKSSPSDGPKSEKRQTDESSKVENLKEKNDKSENPLYSNHAMLVVDNFIKRHMSVLKDFTEMNKRMIENQPYNRINYTTLEETKKWIEKNRPKVMTMEEALEYVKAEF